MRRWTMVLFVALAVAATAGCSDDATTTKDAGTDLPMPGYDWAIAPDAKTDVAHDGPTLGDGPAAADGPVAGDGPLADCPKSEPTAGLGCAQEGKQCGYGTGPECGNVWECNGGKWALAFQGTNCATVPPIGCSATEPTGFCTATNACRYGEVVCRCVNVCSGMQPPPGEENIWACAKPQTVACPSTAPTNTTACTSEGLVCQYGNCSRTTATCTAGKWNVVFQPPPP